MLKVQDVLGKFRRYIDRNREEGHKRLWKDYFDEHPVFPPQTFRRRFRMRRELFVQIVNGISNHSIYFQQRKDVLGNNGLSPLQKCTAAIRQLAYGTTGDLFDEYIRIGESTSIKCLQNFCRCVIEVYSSHYLRKPNANDIQNLLQKHSEKHGFPGMLGSIDCMHWPWENCPVAWQGQYTRGDQGCPTIMLEAVASQDLWIWHAYFGVAGSNNDMNMVYILNGLQWLKVFHIRPTQKGSSLKKCKRLQERMWREHLVFFNLVGQLYEVQQDRGNLKT
ncbi:uncharacterized protein LOC111918667 isoform X1 [Lactuca sativa]|uniref:uncharacterized protein LOC111918667 isoform X1 n=1 Tax=Lactuca sativa TaxID=4236 RepID=UPI0022AEFC9F|nr:uncharacterized protein LOC111918667 isoform X1 [Lactuca sativa]